ncbi:MAG TPA: hypothetical protein VEA69_11530 [Tepidisphaeraceae bacterium]|nr:hypothetical protein [Tepidisphaeraceae bacterium]
MITTRSEYEKAVDELRSVERRLDDLRDGVARKHYTEAGLLKMADRLRDEIRTFDRSNPR